MPNGAGTSTTHAAMTIAGSMYRPAPAQAVPFKAMTAPKPTTMPTLKAAPAIHCVASADIRSECAA
jgi:hypothetical protein